MQRLNSIRGNFACSRVPRPSGFTLTEMLVATALVLLIMTLFAQIYSSALGTMSDQRGLANNDQKARTVSEVLRNDLNQMTFRQIEGDSVRGLRPLFPGGTPAAEQSGYFYYSENNPFDDTDDVLQFTVKFPEGTNNIWSDEGDDAAFFGKATPIGTRNNRPPYYRNPVNQPYFDGPYGSGRSRAAEVSYFLRHGSLYRRVLLIREPPAYVTDDDAQPKYTNGRRVFNADNPNYGGVFWRDFDYSVTRQDGILRFHGLSSLSNAEYGINPTIALPWNRFGHFNAPAGTNHRGRPREYELYNTGDAKFLGRLTLQECSSEDIASGATWPGQYSQIFNREIPRQLNQNGVIDGLESGPRVGEDILLTGVESFDVQIYDRAALSGVGDFVDLGSGDDVSTSRNWNLSYGPRDNTATRPNNVFDTWHPDAVIGNGPLGTGFPPRFALREAWGPTRVWVASTPVPLGTVIFTSPIPSNPTVMSPFVGYRAITAGTTGMTQPAWGGQTVNDNGVVWERFENELGLEAIKITIRFRDVQSTQPRQLTIVHSFAN